MAQKLEMIILLGTVTDRIEILTWVFWHSDELHQAEAVFKVLQN